MEREKTIDWLIGCRWSRHTSPSLEPPPKSAVVGIERRWGRGLESGDDGTCGGVKCEDKNGLLGEFGAWIALKWQIDTFDTRS